MQSKWDELLLIAEVEEYVAFEKANHKAELAKKAAEEAAKKKAENQYNAGVIYNNDAGNATVSETENVNSDAPNHTNNNVDNN